MSAPNSEEPRSQVGTLPRLALAVAMLMLALTPVSAWSGPQPHAHAMSLETTWATYIDPHFAFSVDYPAGWLVTPRDDAPGHIGGSVIFEEPAADNSAEVVKQRVKIEIGMYLVERDPSQPLSEWSERYDEAHDAFTASEMRIYEGVRP